MRRVRLRVSQWPRGHGEILGGRVTAVTRPPDAVNTLGPLNSKSMVMRMSMVYNAEPQAVGPDRLALRHDWTTEEVLAKLHVNCKCDEKVEILKILYMLLLILFYYFCFYYYYQQQFDI